MMTMAATVLMAAINLSPATLPMPDLSALLAISVPFGEATTQAAPVVLAADAVAPPHGYAAMCIDNHALCDALGATNPGPVERDPGAERVLLARINHIVNADVRQETDFATSGVIDKWRRAGEGKGAAGDCEDIAIEKRLELIAAGFPADHLFFAVGFRSNMGLHTVLVAQVDGEELVLDSRTAAITSWRRAPYIWVCRQTPGAPDRWTDPLLTRTATTYGPPRLQG